MRTLAELLREHPEGATAHRPSNRREFMAAVQEMLERGMRVDDIAGALGLTRGGVTEMAHDLRRQDRND